MTLELRPYQQKVVDDMMAHKDTNCCALSATGNNGTRLIPEQIKKTPVDKYGYKYVMLSISASKKEVHDTSISG